MCEIFLLLSVEEVIEEELYLFSRRIIQKRSEIKLKLLNGFIIRKGFASSVMVCIMYLNFGKNVANR